MHAAAFLLLLFAAVIASDHTQTNVTNYKDISPNLASIGLRSHVLTGHKNVSRQMAEHWKELIKIFPSRHLKKHLLLELLSSYSEKDLKKIFGAKGIRYGRKKTSKRKPKDKKNLRQNQGQNKKLLKRGSGVNVKNITVTRGNETLNLKEKTLAKLFANMTVKQQKDQIKKLLRDNLGINIKNIIFSPRKNPPQTQPARKPNTPNKHKRLLKRNRLNHSMIIKGKKLKRNSAQLELPSPPEHLYGNQIVNYYIINDQTGNDKFYYDDGYIAPPYVPRKPIHLSPTNSSAKRSKKPAVKKLSHKIKKTTTKKPSISPNDPTARESIHPEPTTPKRKRTRKPTLKKLSKKIKKPTTKKPSISSTEPTTPTTKSPTEPTTVPTTEPKTGPTTKPTIEPTTEPVTGPTTEPTIKPTTVPITGPPTEPTIEPTTEPITGPTTEPTIEPTTEPITKPLTTEPPSIPRVQPSSGSPNYTPMLSSEPPNSSPYNFPFEVFIKMNPNQFQRQRRRRNHNAGLQNVLFSDILTKLNRNPLPGF